MHVERIAVAITEAEKIEEEILRPLAEQMATIKDRLTSIEIVVYGDRPKRIQELVEDLAQDERSRASERVRV